MRKLARPGGGGPVVGRCQLGVCSGNETGCSRVASVHAAKTQRAGQGKAFLQNLEWAGTSYKDQSVFILLRSLIGLDIGVFHALSTRDQSALCPTWVFYSGSVN